MKTGLSCWVWVLLLVGAFVALPLVIGCDDDDDDNNDTDDDDDNDADDDNNDADDDADDDDNDDADDDDDNDADDDNDDSTPDHGTEQLIINTDFETGTAAPWIGEWPYQELVHSSEPSDDDSTDDDTEWLIEAHSGIYAVWFGQNSMGNEVAWMGQAVDVPEDPIAATVDFWLYIYKFGAATGVFTARLVEAGNPGNVLVDLGTWTEADGAFIAHYEQALYELEADDLSTIAGMTVMLRFDYNDHNPFLTSLCVYLDDVTFTVEW